MYTDEMKVTVFPYTSQPQGEEVILGRVETGVFLALPREAVTVLEHLAEGKTVGQTQEAYFKEHGEVPEMEEFLAYLETKGFLCPSVAGGAPERPAVVPAGAASPVPLRPHFANIPQSFARRVFGPVTLAASAVLVALALAVAFLRPSLVPGPSALIFEENVTFYAVVLLVWGYSTIFLHEMGHLLAARAVGVSSRLGIGHRLWVLVAETDLTGLWSVPRRDRYLPFLAGPLIDLVSWAVLLLVLLAHAEAWIVLPATGLKLVQAMVFVYLMRLLWQCFFFVRTDFYYVIATFFGCSNLLGDTETFLRNQLSRVFKSVRRVDQSHIPAAERRVIHAYAPVWLVGRALAFSMLFFVTIPVMLGYLRLIGGAVRAGFDANPYHFVDMIVVAAFTLVPLVAGLALWLNSLFQSWRKLA